MTRAYGPLLALLSCRGPTEVVPPPQRDAHLQPAATTAYLQFAASRREAHTHARYGEADCGPASVVTVLRLLGKLPSRGDAKQIALVRSLIEAPFGQPTGPEQLQTALNGFRLPNALIASLSIEEIAFSVDCGLPVILAVHGAGANAGRGHAFVVTGHRLGDRERWLVSDPADDRPKETGAVDWWPEPDEHFVGILVGSKYSETCARIMCDHGAVGSLCL